MNANGQTERAEDNKSACRHSTTISLGTYTGGHNKDREGGLTSARPIAIRVTAAFLAATSK